MALLWPRCNSQPGLARLSGLQRRGVAGDVFQAAHLHSPFALQKWFVPFLVFRHALMATVDEARLAEEMAVLMRTKNFRFSNKDKGCL